MVEYVNDTTKHIPPHYFYTLVSCWWNCYEIIPPLSTIFNHCITDKSVITDTSSRGSWTPIIVNNFEFLLNVKYLLNVKAKEIKNFYAPVFLYWVFLYLPCYSLKFEYPGITWVALRSSGKILFFKERFMIASWTIW